MVPVHDLCICRYFSLTTVAYTPGSNLVVDGDYLDLFNETCGWTCTPHSLAPLYSSNGAQEPSTWQVNVISTVSTSYVTTLVREVPYRGYDEFGIHRLHRFNTR